MNRNRTKRDALVPQQSRQPPRTAAQAVPQFQYLIFDLKVSFVWACVRTPRHLRETIYIAELPVSVKPPGDIYYYAEDFLGSSRVITTATGTVCYDADFYPFGGEKVVTNSCAQNYKFTGKERDTETGNDDFGARYYSSNSGRFLSPDWSNVPVPIPFADLTNPQTLNLYQFVKNDPETFVDVDGHLAPGQIGSSEGMFIMPRMRGGGDGDPGATVNGGVVRTDDESTLFALADGYTVADNSGKSAEGQNQGQGQQNQQSDPNKQPSWDPKKPLPDDPSKLGPDWKRDQGHKAPNDERYVNDKTKDKLDWHKGQPAEKGWKGKDHWHWNEHDYHYRPGDTVARVSTVIAVAVVTYWIVSEGSRFLFPPRNFIPVP